MRKFIPLFILALLFLGYGIIKVVPAPKTEIPAEAPPPESSPFPTPGPESPPAESESGVEAPPVEGDAAITAQATPASPCYITDSAFLTQFSMDASDSDQALPRHGLLIAFLLPLLFCGLPGVVMEYFIVRYVQPRGIDLSAVRIRAQDGLFIEIAISMTARRTLRLASTRMTWSRVRNFVEKNIEQELIHDALQYQTLEELERNLKLIADRFLDLPIIHELYRDFGVHVIRFNLETRYPPETIEALNRKADASAGGNAYLAYAAAARLDPDSPESRELYRVFQETTGWVDAARNLGGGMTTLADFLSARRQQLRDQSDDDDS